MKFMKFMKIFKNANVAVKAHDDVNHKYGDYPYSYHLDMVYGYAEKYKHLLPNVLMNVYSIPKEDVEKTIENILLSAWTHDLIEDARYTYNDVKRDFGTGVADITYALTNEKGKTRAERGNDKYYRDMYHVPGAIFIKICDRLANVKHSVDTNSRMLKAYNKEYEKFCDNTWAYVYEPMFVELGGML